MAKKNGQSTETVTEVSRRMGTINAVVVGKAYQSSAAKITPVATKLRDSNVNAETGNRM